MPRPSVSRTTSGDDARLAAPGRGDDAARPAPGRGPAGSGPPTGRSARRRAATRTLRVGGRASRASRPAEGDQADAVALLVGVDQEREDGRLRLGHPPPGPHRPAGVDDEQDRGAGSAARRTLSRRSAGRTISRPPSRRPRPTCQGAAARRVASSDGSTDRDLGTAVRTKTPAAVRSPRASRAGRPSRASAARGVRGRPGRARPGARPRRIVSVVVRRVADGRGRLRRGARPRAGRRGRRRTRGRGAVRGGLGRRPVLVGGGGGGGGGSAAGAWSGGGPGPARRRPRRRPGSPSVRPS